MGASRTEQVAFRGRGDTVGLNVNTWDHTQDTNWSQEIDTTFRVRLEVEEDAGKNVVVAGQLEASLNSTVTYFPVTTISTIVKAVASAQFTDDLTTTNLLVGSLVPFAGGWGSHDGLTPNQSLNNTHLENEYAVQIVGTDVTAGDLIRFRVSSLDAYTQIPVVTVTVPATAVDAPAGHAAATGQASDATADIILPAMLVMAPMVPA